MQFLTNLNLSQNELQNAVLQPLASAPSTGKLGQMYYNSTDKLLYIYDGSAWKAAGAVVSVAGKTGIVTLVKGDVGLGNVDNTSDATKKENFTGQIAEGDTGFVTGGEAYQLGAGLVLQLQNLSTFVDDELSRRLSIYGGVLLGPLGMDGNILTGLPAPINNADAANKGYVDTSISTAISNLGSLLNFKGTVATVAALPLTGMKKGDVYVVTADNSEYVWTSDSATGTISNYEKLGSTVDLSGYLALSGGTMTGPIAMGSNKITGLAAGSANGDAVRYEQLTGLIKTQTGTIATNGTSASVAYSGTLINAYATMGGNIVEVDKAVTLSSVTFTCAQNPSAAVTCTVVYA